MAKRVTVSYAVPLMVTVNLETSEVERVRVVGDGIFPQPDDYAEDAETFRPATQDEVDAAYRIANSGAVWPSWD